MATPATTAEPTAAAARTTTTARTATTAPPLPAGAVLKGTLVPGPPPAVAAPESLTPPAAAPAIRTAEPAAAVAPLELVEPPLPPARAEAPPAPRDPPPALPRETSAIPPAASPAAPTPSAGLPAAAAPTALATPAVVTPPPATEANAIEGVLGRYRHAFSTLDAGAARAVWPSVDARVLGRAFDQLEQQELEFQKCDIVVTGARATAACGGRARYVPKVGSKSPRDERRQWTFSLRKADDRWLIEGVASR